jgi:predicted CoA-binding protein
MPVIAIIGASNDRRKYGNKALRAYRQQGYDVIPINLRETEVEGIRAYRSVLDVGGPIDEVSLYVPADAGLRVLDEVARKGVARVWLNPGADDPRVVDRAKQLGLEPIVACSILAVGESPGAF